MNDRRGPFIIVNARNEYFSGWYCGVYFTPGGSEMYYIVPGWTTVPEHARQYDRFQSALRAQRKCSGTATIVAWADCTPLGDEANVPDDPYEEFRPTVDDFL